MTDLLHAAAVPDSQFRAHRSRIQHELHVNLKTDQVEGLSPDDDWGRRRGNIRHEVKLPAMIFDRKQIPVGCTIEDISATGMALKITEMRAPEPGREVLEQGSAARLEFSPRPHDPACTKLDIPVQVMWRTPVGVGIRFKKVDEPLRAALRTIAEDAVKSRTPDPAVGRHTLALQQRKIMLNCRKTVEKLLPNIIWTLRTETTRRLRQGAEAATAQVARDARAEADLLDEKANAIGRTIEREFLQAFAETSDLDQTIELTVAPMFLKRPAPEAAAAPDVDILSAEAIDQDATVIAIAHAAAERYKLKLFQLNVRLANVVGHPLDAASNPLAPLTACRLFWRATVSYCDSPRVRICLHDTLRTRIVPLLGEVYDALDKSLDDDHVPHAFDSLGS